MSAHPAVGQAPAKCNERSLVTKSPWSLLYIRLKSLKCKHTYLTTANSFCSHLWEMRRKPRDTAVLQGRLVWTRAVGAMWCRRCQAALQHRGLGSWGMCSHQAHVPKAALMDNFTIHVQALLRATSFLPSTYTSSIKSKVVS